jgi:hypothetical protein
MYVYQSHTGLLSPLANKQGTVNSDCGCLQGEWTGNTETHDPPSAKSLQVSEKKPQPQLKHQYALASLTT